MKNLKGYIIIFCLAVVYIMAVVAYCTGLFHDDSDAILLGSADDQMSTLVPPTKVNWNLPTLHHAYDAPKAAERTTPSAAHTGNTNPLPTYSGKTVQSYGGGAALAVGNDIATANPAANGLAVAPVNVPMVNMNVSFATRPNVANKENRVLADNVQKRMATAGSSVGVNPYKAPPTIESIWQKWLEEFYKATGNAEGDFTGLQDWWNATYGGTGGWDPGAYDPFEDWANPAGPPTPPGPPGVPVGNGVMVLLLAAGAYILIRKRNVQLSK